MTGPIPVIGGSGRTGRHIVDRLRLGLVAVRVLSRHGGNLDAELFLGSIADRDAVKRAASDAAGVVVIVESSEEPGPNGPEAVHFHGVQHVIAAAAPTAPIVLVTQIYLIRPEAFERVRDVIVARRRGEEALRASGRPAHPRTCGRCSGCPDPAHVTSTGGPVMQEQTTSDRNVALIQRFYQCYASGDLETMRNQVLAPDVRWTIPGHHPMSGTKQGAEEITAYFRQLQTADFKAETLVLGANDDYVIDCHRGWGRHGDQKLDILWCLLYRIRDGRIAEVVNFAADQHAADAFFWATWQLKPIPDRLEDPR